MDKEIRMRFTPMLLNPMMMEHFWRKTTSRMEYLHIMLAHKVQLLQLPSLDFMAVHVTLLLMHTEGILLPTHKEGIQLPTLKEGILLPMLKEGILLPMHKEEILLLFSVNQVLFQVLEALALILVAKS